MEGIRTTALSSNNQSFSSTNKHMKEVPAAINDRLEKQGKGKISHEFFLRNSSSRVNMIYQGNRYITF